MIKYFAKYIKRDSNPNRKYAFIINGFGKIDNLSYDLYKDFSIFVNNNLDISLNENIICFGPSESGIFLSKFVYENLIYKNKIHIYSNLRTKTVDNKYTIKFKENHCTNNNIHSFIFNYDKYNNYKTLIIIEDEITSGNTIINLINAVSKYFNKIYIFTLLDRRDNENITNIFENIHIKIFSFNINLLNLYDNNYNNILYNPNININIKNIFYIIGECSEKCYDKYINTENSVLRFIPATKYEVDNINIFDLYDLGKDNNNCNYYYYNSFNINNNSNIYIYYYSTQYYIAKNFINYLNNINSNINIISHEESYRTILDNINIYWDGLYKINSLYNDNLINNNLVNIELINNYIINNKYILNEIFNEITNFIIKKSSNNEILLITNSKNSNSIGFLIYKLLERILNIKIEWIEILNLDILTNLFDNVIDLYPNIENIWFIDIFNNKTIRIIKLYKMLNILKQDIYFLDNIQNIKSYDLDILNTNILFISENIFNNYNNDLNLIINL